MKTITTFLVFLISMICPLCFAQDASKKPSRFAASLAPPADTDTKLTAQMATNRKKIELGLRDYLVAFNASHDGRHRIRVGVPLVSLAGDQVHVAYDIGGAGMMLQWKLSELKQHGTSWKLNAFLSQSQTATVAVSANF